MLRYGLGGGIGGSVGKLGLGHRRGPCRGQSGDGGCTYGVVVAETEAETKCLVEVDGVGVQDADVHLPFFEVVGRDEADAWGEGLVDLGWMMLEG